jgi:hypothetical protein
MPRITYDHHIGNIRTRRGESMNKATRMLVMTGMAIAAGVTFSAGPASAASATPASPDSKAATQSAKDWGHDRSRIIGYYSNPFVCHRIGNFGERRGRWDDHTCFRVPFGFHRGDWALRVSWDRHGGFWGGGHDHDNWGGGHDHDNWGGGHDHDNWGGPNNFDGGPNHFGVKKSTTNGNDKY